MTNQVKRPARLDIIDMPRDTTRALGGLRQAICASFNYCRKYPAKMAVLKEVLKYTYNRIVAWEKEYAAQVEQAAKQAEKIKKAAEQATEQTTQATKQAVAGDKAKANKSDEEGKKVADTSGE